MAPYGGSLIEKMEDHASGSSVVPAVSSGPLEVEMQEGMEELALLEAMHRQDIAHLLPVK